MKSSDRKKLDLKPSATPMWSKFKKKMTKSWQLLKSPKWVRAVMNLTPLEPTVMCANRHFSQAYIGSGEGLGLVLRVLFLPVRNPKVLLGLFIINST